MIDYTLDDLLRRPCFVCSDDLHLSDCRWLYACEGLDLIVCDDCHTPKLVKRLRPIVVVWIEPTYHYSRDP